MQRLNQRCRATIYELDGGDAVSDQKDVWGYCVNEITHHWPNPHAPGDTEPVVFYDIRLDDGSYMRGIYEDDIYFCGYHSKTDYAEEYAES